MYIPILTLSIDEDSLLDNMMNIAAFLLFGEDIREVVERRQRERRERFRQLKMQRRRLRDASNPFTDDHEYFRLHYR